MAEKAPNVIRPDAATEVLGAEPKRAANEVVPRPEAALPYVDPRVLMANERTLLAWIRTGVGLMAFGFVVGRAGVWVRSLGGEIDGGPGTFRFVGAGLVVLGVSAVALGWFSFQRSQAVLLSGNDRLPKNYAAPLISALLIAVGVVLAAVVVVLSS